MIWGIQPRDILGDRLPSADEDVARLRLEFRHLSLSELEEIGLVRRDREADLVRKGPSYDSLDL